MHNDDDDDDKNVPKRPSDLPGGPGKAPKKLNYKRNLLAELEDTGHKVKTKTFYGDNKRPRIDTSSTMQPKSTNTKPKPHMQQPRIRKVFSGGTATLMVLDDTSPPKAAPSIPKAGPSRAPLITPKKKPFVPQRYKPETKPMITNKPRIKKVYSGGTATRMVLEDTSPPKRKTPQQDRLDS